MLSLAESIEENGIDVPLKRKPSSSSFDDTSSKNWPLVGTIRVGRHLDPPLPTPSENGKQYTQTGKLYVLRGVEVLDGDRVELPEGPFGVVGGAQNDHPNVLDNHDFGVKRYQIRRGG